ncbi:MAG: signal peptide peptidase SppA [Candidatus Coatesbacteria bacterium]|nr:signal peptide peptidase SppA [Candidatus Coatesbacteria bacterium]
MSKTGKIVLTVIIVFLVLTTLLSITIAIASLSKSDGSFGFEQVAVVEIKSEIRNVNFVLKTLENIRKKKSVKAVVIRIDSPGGGVAPSQEIYESILKLRKSGKKVIATMGTVSASGGYYIACACDKIVANPGTLTGSIGVILLHYDISPIMDKIGVKVEPIKSSAYKDIMSPFRPMEEAEKKLLLETVTDVYEQFIEVVSKGRNLSKGFVKQYADGRIFTGRQAKKYNFVDELGTYEDAIDLAKKEANLKKEASVKYYKKPKKLWFDMEDVDQKLDNLSNSRIEILYRMH